VQALLASDIPYMSLPQAMGEFLIKDRHSIVIAGTHGKTTTTALAAWIAESAGLKPGFLIGGIPLNFPESFSIGEGQFFVIEGDEYDTAFFDKVPKFIHYRPKSVILTSIEFDHADIYRDLDHVKEAFTKLLALIPIDGHLVYNGEDENILSLLNHSHSHSHSSYGQNKKTCEWTIDGIEFFESHSQFDVLRKGRKEDTIRCQLMGEYNLMNALSVYVLARQLGLDRNAVLKSFESFRGVKRRQEVIGTPGGITVIDDFAHHPTAVKLTIEGVKKRFTKGKVFGVFEPRSATAMK
jgi:UDP-N-acetylmuramate: L-alanyl-gamma-D-glutamyl-meso-diaminopimelate ligase